MIRFDMPPSLLIKYIREFSQLLKIHANYAQLAVCVMNCKAYQEKEHLYKRRQAIVEHPYGTLKRQWGFNYILTKKGISRASADVGFMFIAYNLRRIGNILTRDQLREYLRILISLFLSKIHFSILKNSQFRTTFFRVSVWDIIFPYTLVPA